MTALGMILIATMLVGVLSSLRIAGIADPIGVELEDRLFRITLIALRLAIIGGLVYVVVALLREEGR